jgi:hypothetical protein
MTPETLGYKISGEYLITPTGQYRVSEFVGVEVGNKQNTTSEAFGYYFAVGICFVSATILLPTIIGTAIFAALGMYLIDMETLEVRVITHSGKLLVASFVSRWGTKKQASSSAEVVRSLIAAHIK